MTRWLLSLAPLAVASFANADERPDFNAYADAEPLPVTAAVPRKSAFSVPSVHVASRDEQRGVPSFLWAIRDQIAPPGTSAAGVPLAALSPEQAAKLHLTEHAESYGLSADALATAGVVRVLDVGRGGIIVVFQQRVGGVDLFHNKIKILMNRDLDLVAIGGNLHAAAVPSPQVAPFRRTPADALAIAFNDLFAASLGAADFIDTKQTQGDYQYFELAKTPAATSTGVRFARRLRVKRVYFPMPDRIVPAHYLEVLGRSPSRRASDGYAYVVAADDGRLLHRENLIHTDTFNYRVWADATGDKRPLDGPLADTTPYPFPAPNGSYPGFVLPSLVAIDGFNVSMDPWLPAGATETLGNNVDAYTDDDTPNGFSAGDTRAFTTSASTFDLLYDVTAAPQSSVLQSQAAVTQLFYTNNWLHDWWYDSGFDEAGGNAQMDNFGRGGIEGDPLHAQAQEGPSLYRNNAYMYAGADGESPQMRMYLWHGAGAQLTIDPGNLSFAMVMADFPPFVFSTSASVVLADDGASPDTGDGCEPIVNDVSGRIALVREGPCFYKQQAANAQDAGAVGVILVGPAGSPVFLVDTDQVPAVITIPMVAVTQSDGAAIEATVLSGPTTATLASVDPVDSTIDNSIIAHEFGHLLHFRTVACFSQACGAESEGFGDFLALMLAARPGDDLAGAFSFAQYSAVQWPDAAYFGLRRFPFSVDFTKNPLTFKHITNGEPMPAGAPINPMWSPELWPNAEVHDAGEVWASMLWEGYVAMLQAAEGPSPPYSFDEARRRMSDYVVAGMVMAPDAPTFTEQRDGILAAAFAADPSDHARLAEGFARRGAGTCAVSPPRFSTDFVGVVESFVLVPDIAIDSVTLDDTAASCDNDGRLDGGEAGYLTIQATNRGTMGVPSATATLSTTTPGVTFPDGATVSLGTMDVLSTTTVTTRVAIDLSVAQKGILELVVTSDTPGCDDATRAAYFSFNADEGLSNTDDVEATESAWEVKGAWFRVESMGGNHLWSGFDTEATLDSSLVSPPLVVGTAEPVVMSFTHRHSFDTHDGVYWDGAVIELSEDGGTTWSDISTLGDPGYGGTIGDPTGQMMNALATREGYVATNPSWPATDTVSIALGTALAGKTVQVRLRMGMDDAGGDVGWEVDDIGFTGLTNLPFSALVDDPHACSPGGTGGAGGAGGSAVDGDGGSGAVEPRGGGGCACGVGHGPPANGAAFGWLAGVAALVTRQRRRACRSRARQPWACA